MPAYDYRCGRCGTFEVRQLITELPLTVCPTCGGPVTRLLSANINIVYKGSGWHCTDYRSKRYKDDALLDKETTSEQQSKPESTSAAS